MRWLWARRYWVTIALALVGVAVAYFFGRREADLSSSLAIEAEAIKAKAKAREVEAKLGADNARRWVEEMYADEAARLDADAARRAVELRDNPGALADYLVRVGRRAYRDPASQG